MLLSRAHDLSPFTSSFPNLIRTPIIFPLRTAFSLARSLSTSDPYHPQHQNRRRRRRFCHTFSIANKKRLDKCPPGFSRFSAGSAHHSSDSTLVGQSVSEDQKWNFSNERSDENIRVFKFDASFGSKLDDNLFNTSSLPSLDVKELAELPDQWRRSRLAWLCKDLPAHKSAMVTRILNAQRKWVTQEDITYVAVHCMRIRENETAFRVYKWMMQQHWFKFDFSLATKLAEYMGKERKYLKCREVFDDIVNHGLVPTELTFHILVVAYLSSSARGCLEEACAIYNRMIQLGGYKPRLSLHNSLFKALVTRPRGDSKQYLNQAEFMFHNMVMSGFKIHKDMYGGLIWLHSYQDIIDKERIATLRAEMQLAGFEESSEVLLSVLRACSKEGDVEETERTWKKLLSFSRRIPSQAFVYRMEVYAKIGEPMRSLEVFRSMQEQLSSASIVAFHKIIEVLCKAQAVELSESLMKELIDSGMKPLVPSFIDLMDMYFTLNMHGDLECAFLQCLERCRPNRTIYNIYLKSLVEVGSLDKAEEILRQMQNDEDVGVDTGSCNTILRGYLDSGEHVKAKQMYDLMSQKKYNIDTALLEKLEYVLKSKKEIMKKPTTLQLSKEQREVLVGLLLGGLRIESDEKRKNHMIIFQFNENSDIHNVLNWHLHDQYHEWLASSDQQADGGYDTISQFSTISHSYFNFYANQFRPKGQHVIPKLIHRWLSPRVLAYWYMYAGYKTSSGDILLKLRGSQEDVDKIVKTLQTKSLSCRVKSKGKVFWIGLFGSNSTWFWKLVNPYILDDLKDLLKPGYLSSDGTEEAQGFSFGGHSDSDNMYSVYSEDYIS